MTKQERLIELIRQNPGLSGLELKKVGYRPQRHGSLLEAERAGIIEYINDGWRVKGDK